MAPLILPARSGYKQWNGTDAVGAFMAHEWTWQYTEAFPMDPFGCNPRRWVHTLHAYGSAVRFTQAFPEGMDQQRSCSCETASTSLSSNSSSSCDCSGTSAWPALRPATTGECAAYQWALGTATGRRQTSCKTWNCANSTTSWHCSSSRDELLGKDAAGDSGSGSRLFSGAMDRARCNITGTCSNALVMGDESVLNFGVVGCWNCTQNAIAAGTTIEAWLRAT